MELSEELIRGLLGPGANIGALVLFIFYLYKRDQKNDERAMKTVEAAQIRETALGERLNRVEDEQKGKLVSLVEITSKALTDTANSLRQLDNSLKRLPCYLDANHADKKNVSA